MFFFCKQKTAYEMRISYWSSDVCSSDLTDLLHLEDATISRPLLEQVMTVCVARARDQHFPFVLGETFAFDYLPDIGTFLARSEEHTSELQSLMRISYAVFCLKKKTILTHTLITSTN